MPDIVIKTGTIRKLREGYGFIAGNDGTDYFLHWTQVAPGGPTFRELQLGNRVEFEPYFDAPKGPRALNAKVVA